jgi:phage baseplate assembly protein W
MSELGSVVRDVQRRADYLSSLTVTPIKPIGIKTPLEKGNRQEETLFKMHFDVLSQVEDNLKNLIMTQKGERLGFPDYGTQLKEIYSDNTLTDDEIVNLASEQIKEVVKKYMPSIDLADFYSSKLGSESKQQNSANNVAYEFLNKQGSVITNLNIPTLDEKNKIDISKDSIFEISISYFIPLVDKKTRVLKLIINSSK